MKKGWQTKRLGDVCEIIKGRKPALKATSSNGDLPYLVAKVMRGSKEAEYASVKDRNSISVEESETIIICDGSNSGEVFTGFRGILSSTMGKIAKKAKIDDDYLRAFLASTFDVFNGAKTGAAIPHLDKEAMYQLQFPFPPLAEQQRIVGLLDEAFAGLATAKANAKKNLQNARALFESHLQSVYTQRGPGWQTKKLGDVSDVMNGGTPKTGVPEYWAGQHRWITPAEMGKRVSPYVSDTERKITDLGLRDSSARMLPPNSVILSSRAPIGHLVINTEPMGTNQGCKGLIPHSQIETKFLYYYLSSIVDLLNSLGTGATFKELSGGKLKEVTVPVPSLAEQQKIGAKLDRLAEETQRLARLYERKQAALEALKKSLLHQAFNGEL